MMLCLDKSKLFLRKKLPELLQLAQDLNYLEANYPEPLDRIVIFFNLISPWHDELPKLQNEFCRFRSGNIKDKFEVLFKHFKNAGRCSSGWNRTQPGEQVTGDKVFLGNIFGLFTKTSDYWKTTKDSPKGGWGYPGMENLNPYDVVSRQAIDFIKSHMPIIDLINELERLA